MADLLDGPDKEVPAIRRQLRTPRAAGFAGLVFSVLLVLAMVLVQVAIRATPSDSSIWLTDQTHRQAVLAALGLMPFAAIAFLWFIGVVRDHIGDQEDRFFATVFPRQRSALPRDDARRRGARRQPRRKRAPEQ